ARGRARALACRLAAKRGTPYLFRHRQYTITRRRPARARVTRGTPVSAVEPKIHVIGVGSDGLAGLTARARELLAAADIVLGSEPPLALLPELKAQGARIGPDLPEAVRTREGTLGRKRMVVAAGGDPLFYGVARYLCDRLGKDRFEVLPHVSSMQLAFARIKESWEEAYLTNLATHPLDSVLDRIRTAEV